MIEANVWQRVPGTTNLEIFPLITKPSIISSNCYILAGPNLLLVIDPGASPEQTQRVSEIVSDALEHSQRPVLIFLTHCHQDHSQEAGRLDLPVGTVIKRFAHQAGVEALQCGDRYLTVAYLYPWEPDVCQAPFEGQLFASEGETNPTVLECDGTWRAELYRETRRIPDGEVLDCQHMPLGSGVSLAIYHTPGHTPCSISLHVGELLFLGDLPFATNPGLCGLDGWNHADLRRTLRKVDWLLATAGITVCCPGHGCCVAAKTMRQKLLVMEDEARELADIQTLNANRIATLKDYADELLEEAVLLSTIISGRLYTVSYHLSALEENVAAQQLLEVLDLDAIDRVLSDFRSFVQTFNASTVPSLTLVMKGVQVAAKLQQLFVKDTLRQVIDASLMGRTQRLLADYLSTVRGLQFLNAEMPGAVNDLIEQLLKRVKQSHDLDSADLLMAAHDDQAFLDLLVRRLVAYSPLRDAEFEFQPTPQKSDANVGAERLVDILTGLIEGIVGSGVTHIRIATDVVESQVTICISSNQPITLAAFGNRRLDLYNRILGWLGGRLELSHPGGQLELIAQVPAVV